jgi:hypothetical protein
LSLGMNISVIGTGYLGLVRAAGRDRGFLSWLRDRAARST